MGWISHRSTRECSSVTLQMTRGCLLPDQKRNLKIGSIKRVKKKYQSHQNTQEKAENQNLKSLRKQAKAPQEHQVPIVKTPIMQCEMKVMLLLIKEEERGRKLK